jgi:23S rRNA pseudouridine1911/1915/1917 synthase
VKDENLLDIIYEDNQLVVVIKPQNISSQADKSGEVNMLDLVKDYVKIKYNKPGEAFIGLVHRLDQPVGGVMAFARNSKSANRISQQIQNGEFERTYLAVVQGAPRQNKNRLVNYIKKDTNENKSKIVPMSEQGAKKAEMEYEVLETIDDLSLLKVKLITGRSHQIRLQLANIGTPIFGDMKYGLKKSVKDEQKFCNLKTTELALWAFELIFKHPTQNKNLKFKVFPPEEKMPWLIFNLGKLK